MIIKATKKPVTIEAVLWDKSGRTQRILNETLPTSTYRLCYENTGTCECPELYIKTLEGEMHVSEGDYIIKGVKGEFYPCKPDIFHMTYDIEVNS